MASVKNHPNFDTKGKVTRAEAARLLGVSRSQVARLVDRGLIEHELDPGGVMWFTLAHIEAARGKLNISEDTSAADIEEQRNKLVDISLEFVRKIFDPVTKATEQTMNVLLEENTSLREQTKELHATHQELLKAREAALTENHIRAALSKESDAEIARKDSLIAILKEAAGPLSEQIKATIRSKDLFSEFLRTVPRDKLTAILKSGVLSEAELAILVAALQNAGIAVEVDSEPTPSDTEN